MPHHSAPDSRPISPPISPPPISPRSTPLEVAEARFLWLATGPRPLSINGGWFPELPNRPMPLHQLRTRLATRRLQPGTEDQVWAHLVARARTENHPHTTVQPTFHSAGHGARHGAIPGDTSSRGAGHGRTSRATRGPARSGRSRWTVACVGVAMPVLTRTAANLSIRYRGDAADLEAAVLVGFLAELHRTDVCLPGILPRLCRAAHGCGRQLRDALTSRSAGEAPAYAGEVSATVVELDPRVPRDRRGPGARTTR